MNVLALDPSSEAMGWAVADTVGSRSGAWRPRAGGWASKCSKEQLHVELCGRVASWLSDMITEHEPSVLVIECGGGRMSDRCSERLRGALFTVAWTREVATVQVHPATWQAWVRRNLPSFVKSDETDAYGILRWWLATQAHRVEAALGNEIARELAIRMTGDAERVPVPEGR
jgi:hypothetical protein